MGGAAAPSSSEPAGPFILRHQVAALGYCAFFVCGAILYGYDGTYFTGILEMEPFKRAVGDITDANGNPGFSSGALSLLASIVQVGELVGSLSAGFVGDRFGRCGGFFSACILLTIGIILQLVREGPEALFVVGRLILGMGIGQISNAVPLYLSEVPPTVIRGIVVGSWQLFLAIGQVIGAGVSQGTKDIPNSASYRIPIGVNLVIPIIVFAAIWFVPESPRWLVAKGRNDKARRNLYKINKSNPDYNPDESLDSYIRDHERAVAESQQKNGWSELFTDKVEFRKLVSVFGILAGQQITGVQFIFSYATVIATNLQLANPFLITMIINVVEVVGVLASYPLIIKFGRKPLIFWTSVVMIVSMMIIGGMGSGPMIAPTVPPTAYGQTAIAFICVYVFAFNAAWGPLAWVLATECCPGPNRSRIMAVGTAAFWIVAWAVTFTLPYLYNENDGAGLGLKIGYIYSGGCTLAVLFMLYIGETKGRTLEDINVMFARRIPARKWKTYQISELDRVVTREGEPSAELDRKVDEKTGAEVAATQEHKEVA